MSRCVVVVFLLLGWVCSSRAQLGVSTEDMQNAVRSLAERFTVIRDEGLGIDTLEDALRGASYTSETLSDQDIDTLLDESAQALEGRVNAFLTLFDEVTSAVNVASPPSTPATPAVLCCDPAAASAGQCVYAQSETDANAAVLDTLAAATLEEGEKIMVGTVDGTIIHRPSQLGDCTNKPDARLQPWFATEARSNPLEVVILMDLIPFRNSPFVDNVTLDTVRRTASLILNSLTTADRIGLVGVDRTRPRLPSVIERIHGSSPPRVVPVCTDTIIEIDEFITTSFTPVAAQSDEVSYAEAFTTAFSLFSTNTEGSIDQLLLYVVPGEFQGLRQEMDAIQAAISAGGTAVNTSFYVGGAFPGTFSNLATNGADGVIQVAPVELSGNPPPNFSLVGGFYNIDSARDCSADPVCTVTFGHAGAGLSNSLTLRRPLIANDTFLGVLYATLPFNELLGPLLDTTDRRKFSYPFVAGANHLPLFHRLLPGDGVARVLITELEPENVIAGVLAGSPSPAEVTKQHLVYTGSTDVHSTTLLTLPSSYHCREVTFANVVGVANTTLSICYVLAEGERTLRTLSLTPENIQEIYQSVSSPIYHDILETVESENRCNYFCKLSTPSRVSFQLTNPSTPPSNYPNSLIDEMTAYIKGLGNRPDFVSEGVAEEAALGVSVAEDWMETVRNPSDFITRRHLATPNGLYLTYPPSHLVPNFEPLLTEWYRAPSAHPSLLTLGTPQVNPLKEGGRLTVSVGFAVRAPSSEDDLDLGDGGQPLAVVSGDITLDSLRLFVREALPRCEENPVSCVIVDDSGNLVYEKEADNFNGVTRFFAEEETRRVVLANLTGLASKRQCTDLFNVVTKTRRFYVLDTSQDDVFVNPAGHCAEYRVQHIPGTNAFLMVYEKNDCTSRVFCPCIQDCLNCRTFTSAFCECPCSCADDCELATDSSFMCPLITTDNSADNSNYDRVEAEQINGIQPDLPFCFQQNCSCRQTLESCFGVRDCHWCEEEQKCAHVTECCSVENGRSCCGTPAEQDRLLFYQDTCLEFARECFAHPVMNVTCPATTSPTTPPSSSSSSNTSTIVAAVVGALVGLILVVLIVILILYYQLCRKPDPEEANSRESAFDFSNKTALGTGGEGKNAKSPKRNSEHADIEKAIAEEQQEVTPPKDTDETTM